MRFNRSLIVLAVVAFGALRCIAQEPAQPQSNDDLRREVAELRASVAELTRRLEAFEYQAIPRAELKNPQLAEPPPSPPSYVLPLAHPAGFPVDMRNNEPSSKSTPKQMSPRYLRFSEQVERAMMSGSTEVYPSSPRPRRYR